MRNFHENVAAGAALPRNVQFPDISVEEIGFLEQFRATGYLWLRLLGSAGTPLPRLALGNLQRRGLTLSSNTPPRLLAPKSTAQFTGKKRWRKLFFKKSVSSNEFSLRDPNSVGDSASFEMCLVLIEVLWIWVFSARSFGFFLIFFSMFFSSWYVYRQK